MFRALKFMHKADSDGTLPGESHELSRWAAMAPHRAPGKYRRLVRSLAYGYGQAGIRGRTARRGVGEKRQHAGQIGPTVRAKG